MVFCFVCLAIVPKPSWKQHCTIVTQSIEKEQAANCSSSKSGATATGRGQTFQHKTLNCNVENGHQARPDNGFQQTESIVSRESFAQV